MNKISYIKAREILDSRGDPTVEVDIVINDKTFGRSSVPSGASTGSHEAVELRDKDNKRYGGKGVLNAVSNVNDVISKAILGKEFDQCSLDQALIDLDATPHKSQLGANAILAVSLAFARASASDFDMPLYEYFNKLSDGATVALPEPMMNVLNGGKHALNSTDVQEFMIVPRGFASFKESLRAGSEIFHALKSLLASKKLPTTVGDEGGFALSQVSNESAITLLLEAISKTPYRAGKDIFIAIDVAATELYKDKRYSFARDNRLLSSEEVINWYGELVAKYPIISIEDGLAEDDWNGYKKFTESLAHKVMIVGDDLFATNVERLSAGIERQIGNAILIKLNQIGTVSETIAVIDLARKANYKTIVSHRSGETEDTTIADLAVGTGSMIKTGSLSRTDRVAKYNQLLRIEESTNKSND